MTMFKEIKNNSEITEIFKTIQEVKLSAIGWLEVYQDIDDKNYHNEINIIKNTNDLNTINNELEVFGYKYLKMVY